METRDDDEWPAWGRLIDDARDRLRPAVSQNEAARRLGMTGTNWRRIVQGRTGSMESPRGVQRLAHMAMLAKVLPEELEEVGRDDVADELRRSLRSATRRPPPGDDFDSVIARIRQHTERRRQLLDVIKATRLDPADDEEDSKRKPEAG